MLVHEQAISFTCVLYDSRDVGDSKEEVKFSFVEPQRWTGQRLLDLFNDVLQLFADLIYARNLTVETNIHLLNSFN